MCLCLCLCLYCLKMYEEPVSSRDLCPVKGEKHNRHVSLKRFLSMMAPCIFPTDVLSCVQFQNYPWLQENCTSFWMYMIIYENKDNWVFLPISPTLYYITYIKEPEVKSEVTLIMLLAGNVQEIKFICTLMEDKTVQSPQFMCPFDWEYSHRLFSVYLAELIALFLRLHLHSSLNKDTICLLPA